MALVLYARGISASTPTLLFVSATVNVCAALWIFFRIHSLCAVGAASAVRIDSECTIWLRDVSTACRPIYVSSVLVVLETPARVYVVWCDMMDRDGFRQLVVAARWSGREVRVGLDAVDQNAS